MTLATEKILPPFDATTIRKDFPLLARTVNGKPLIYFDSGATAQKPREVIEAITNYYTHENANIHRGVHRLSQDTTLAYEQGRITVQKHLNAAQPYEIIFTSGTTESINLVASSIGKKWITAGDEVLVTEMEHHSNILPWQMMCEEKGAKLKVVPVNEQGELRMDVYQELLTSRTKMVAVTHVSNTLGTINPLKEIITLAHQKNIPVLVDGAQAVPHLQVDVQALDADFYCFSGHKLFGPTGIGVLYGKEKLLNELPPYQVGGGTIKTVRFDGTSYADLPLKFEAGTPHIAGVIGLAAAINYIRKTGLNTIHQVEEELLHYATKQLTAIENLHIIGTAAKKAGVISFVVNGVHPFDIGTILDQMGIAVRTGHHCTQPLMERYQVPGTVRVSLAFYNTTEEIDELVKGIKKAIKLLR